MNLNTGTIGNYIVELVDKQNCLNGLQQIETSEHNQKKNPKDLCEFH